MALMEGLLTACCCRHPPSWHQWDGCNAAIKLARILQLKTLLIIWLVPFRNCLAEVVHQNSIEGVGLGSSAVSHFLHKVPYIQSYLPVTSSLKNKRNNFVYLQMTTLSKQLRTPRWPSDRAAISVGVQQVWGILPGLLIPKQQARNL